MSEENEGTLKIVRLLSGVDVVGTTYDLGKDDDHTIAIAVPAKLMIAYEMEDELLQEGDVPDVSTMMTLSDYQPYAKTKVAVIPYHAIESICDVNDEMGAAYISWRKGESQSNEVSMDASVPEGTLFS